MATSTPHFDGNAKHGAAAISRAFLDDRNLDDDRIIIDIETERIIHSQMYKELEPAPKIPHFSITGKTAGPLSVLLVLLVYFLLSPLLSPTIHEYIYRILH